MTQFKITTNDNPFDPFDDWDNWLLFDIELGYYSCSKLDRIAKLRDDFSEVEINIEIERAIDAIVMHDFTDSYKKMSRDYPDIEESNWPDDIDSSEDFDESKKDSVQTVTESSKLMVTAANTPQ